MEHAIERQLTVPETPEEVWESLVEPDWLGEEALIELRPSGEVRAGERTGFVEEVEPPRRLSFWWWSEEGGESTRVEIELDEAPEGTRVRVTESRPLAILDLGGPALTGELEPRPPAPELSGALLLR